MLFIHQADLPRPRRDRESSEADCARPIVEW